MASNKDRLESLEKKLQVSKRARLMVTVDVYVFRITGH